MTTQPLKYLLTYKLSQDHIKHFFGCVRSHGGCNNNPTARQFTAIYKRLLTHHEVKAINGNCIQIEDVPILVGKNSKPSQQEQSVSTLSIIDNMLKYNIFPEPQQTEDDEAEYGAMSDLSQIKLFKENAVTWTCSTECK